MVQSIPFEEMEDEEQQEGRRERQRTEKLEHHFEFTISTQTLRELKQLRQELRQIQQQGGSGKQQGKLDKKGKDPDRKLPDKCGLCGSKEHVYWKGAYLHRADEPITNRCPKTDKAGKQCKLFHAYTGELETPCEF